MKLVVITLIALFVSFPDLWAKSKIKLPDSYAFTRGVEAYQEGKHQDALDWFNKELSDHPDNGYAYIYISALRSSMTLFDMVLPNDVLKNTSMANVTI